MFFVYVESYEDLSRLDKVELIFLIYYKNYFSLYVNVFFEYMVYLKRGFFLKFKKCFCLIDFFKIF